MCQQVIGVCCLLGDVFAYTQLSLSSKSRAILAKWLNQNIGNAFERWFESVKEQARLARVLKKVVCCSVLQCVAVCCSQNAYN